MQLTRSLALVSLFFLPALALAQAEAEAPKTAATAPASTPAAAPAPAPAPTTAELQTAVTAAKDAAVAAKEAAEAARDATAALKTALAGHAAKAPAKKGEEEKEEKKEEKKEGEKDEEEDKGAFTYQLGLGLIAVTGNANAVTGKVSGGAEGEWASWGVKLLVAAAYGQATTEPTATEAEPKKVTALNGLLSLRGDRKMSETFSVYLQTGVNTDHVASIEVAGLGEGGASLTWWERKNGEDFVKSRLSTDLGFRFTHEERFQYYPAKLNQDDVDIYAPRLGVALRYALTKKAVFTEEAEILTDLVNTKNLRANSTTTLTAQLGSGVSLNVAFKIRHIGDPAEGKKPTDTQLSAGVAWAF